MPCRYRHKKGLICMEKMLPSIPVKRYFTIGEVSDLCGVKPYVLRYWEQEFSQLRPMKRRGNRRYYQHHEVLLIRRIRELLYDEGFTISGARNRLADVSPGRDAITLPPPDLDLHDLDDVDFSLGAEEMASVVQAAQAAPAEAIRREMGAERPLSLEGPLSWQQVRDELISIRALLV
jgi:DNA-binding transcriptional MerR regulator